MRQDVVKERHKRGTQKENTNQNKFIFNTVSTILSNIFYGMQFKFQNRAGFSRKKNM
jgi:hypothetical protein